MLNKVVIRFINFIILSIILPVVYGCNGTSSTLTGDSNAGGAISGLAGSLGGDGGGVGAGGEGSAMATIHNPEPATMFLLGSGLIAINYYKNRNSKFKN